jgi:hypothetical protein
VAVLGVVLVEPVPLEAEEVVGVERVASLAGAAEEVCARVERILLGA